MHIVAAYYWKRVHPEGHDFPQIAKVLGHVSLFLTFDVIPMLIYDSPGFWSKIKEKGSVAKEAWGVIGSALSVQQVMQDMERLASKGEVDEEELKAMELDMTGKIMLASWRGTRFEVVQVLREVSLSIFMTYFMS